MRAADLCASVRRFAPGALAASPHHRAAWCIRTLPVCVRTLEILRSTCPCGRRQGWTSARDVALCDGCGRQLALVAPLMPPEEDLAPLRRYADLFSPDADERRAAVDCLPDELRHLRPDEVVELILCLLPSTSPGRPVGARSDACWLDDGAGFAAAVARTWRLLERWSEGPVEAAIGIPPRAATARCPELIRAGRLLQDPERQLPGPVRGVIARAAARYSSQKPGEAAAIDYHEAEAVLGHRRRTLQQEREAGRLATRFILRTGEIFPALDRREVEELAGTAMVSAAALARRFSVPRYAVEQLAAAGLLEELGHPFIVSVHGFVIAEGSATSLVGRLEDAALPRDDGPGLSLLSALNACGGGEKPFAHAIGAMLDGRLAFTLRDPAVPLARRLVVRREDFPHLPSAVRPALGQRRFPHYVQEDVRSILGVHARDAVRLSPLAVGRSGSSQFFDRDDVLDVAAEMVSRVEVATILDLRGRALDRWWRDQDVGTPGTFGWPRHAVPADARSKRPRP